MNNVNGGGFVPPPPQPILLSELKKWNGLSHFDESFLSDIKLAFIFNEMAAIVKLDDRVFMVGKNCHGSLGTGDVGDFYLKVPGLIPALSNIKICEFAFCQQKVKSTFLESGTNSSPTVNKSMNGNLGKRKVASYFALTTDYHVYGWGYNGEGNLGLRRQDLTPVLPTRVSTLDNLSIIKLACGSGHTLAMSMEGRIWAWGKNNSGQVGSGTLQNHYFPVEIKIKRAKGPDGDETIIRIACGYSHSVALAANGKVYTWGLNDRGQLGIGSKEKFISTPTWVSGLKDVNIRKIACGKHHTLVMSEEGKLWSWGSNNYGQLGNKSTIKSRSPVRIEFSREIFLRDIAAVPHHTFSICLVSKANDPSKKIYMWTEKGSIYSWGYNDYGEMGTGIQSESPATPMRIKGPLEHEDVVRIACGSDHTLAVTRDYKIFSWGYNFYGQLGYSSGGGDYHPSPRQITDFPRSVKIIYAAGGLFHSVALTSDGEVFGWGKNDKHQLGIVTTSKNIFTPELVKFRGAVIKKVVCGPDCTFALSDIGDLYFFGYCEITKNEASLPVRVEGFDPDDPVEDVETAHWAQIYACTTRSGKVYMWGQRKGKGNPIETPEIVPTASSIDDVFAFYSNPPAMVRPLVMNSC